MAAAGGIESDGPIHEDIGQLALCIGWQRRNVDEIGFKAAVARSGKCGFPCVVFGRDGCLIEAGFQQVHRGGNLVFSTIFRDKTS